MLDATADPRTPGRVRHVPVPPDARTRSGLDRIDYENAVFADLGPETGRTAEQWARAILEGVPANEQQARMDAFRGLGLQLGPFPSDDHVLGWPVVHNTPDTTLVGAASTRGLHAELLVQVRPDGLLFAYFNQQDTDEVRTLWASIDQMHGPIMQQMLEQAIT